MEKPPFLRSSGYFFASLATKTPLNYAPLRAKTLRSAPLRSATATDCVYGGLYPPNSLRSAILPRCAPLRLRCVSLRTLRYASLRSAVLRSVCVLRSALLSFGTIPDSGTLCFGELDLRTRLRDAPLRCVLRSAILFNGRCVSILFKSNCVTSTCHFTQIFFASNRMGGTCFPVPP